MLGLDVHCFFGVCELFYLFFRDPRFECDRARHGEQQSVQSLVSVAFHPSQGKMHKSHANITYISVMLALFPDFFLCKTKGNGGGKESMTEDCLSLWSVR